MDAQEKLLSFTAYSLKAVGYIDKSYSTEEPVKWYTMLKRSVAHNRLLMNLQLPLSEYSETMATFFLNGLKSK